MLPPPSQRLPQGHSVFPPIAHLPFACFFPLQLVFFDRFFLVLYIAQYTCPSQSLISLPSSGIPRTSPEWQCLDSRVPRKSDWLSSADPLLALLISCDQWGTWRRQWHPTPVLLPGESRGQRSLEGCGPWGRWGSDLTERLYFQFSLSCIGEGNGNPLQCSFLENPRNRGAWWAAVYGVTQSQICLKRLSSSSSEKQNHISEKRERGKLP